MTKQAPYKMVAKKDIEKWDKHWNELGHSEKAFAHLKWLAERLLRERDAYRTVAIKFRTLWGEQVEPIGRYDEIPIKVDSEAARLMEKDMKHVDVFDEVRGIMEVPEARIVLGFMGPSADHNLICWLCGENKAVYDMYPNWIFRPCWKCQDEIKPKNKWWELWK